MHSLVGNDATFGPQYRGPGGARLDFTLKFLEVILQILPTTVFMVLAALLVVAYRRRSVNVKPGPLLWTKQPFLLRRMMQYVGQDDAPESIGNALVGATVAVFVGIAAGRSEAMTLMSTDVEGIATGIPLFYDASAAVIELGLGLYLLSTVVDKAAFLGIFPICLSTVAATIIGKKMGPARANWNKFIETRVAKTAAALANAKGIKMLGLEPMVIDFIQRLRIEEVQSSKPFRVLTAITSATAMFCYAITPVVVISGALFWTTFNGKLNAVDTFTALAFILLIQVPLVILLRAYPNFAATMASFQRIQDYLLQDEAQDSRLSTNDELTEDSTVLEKDSKAIEAGWQTTSSPESCVIRFSNVTLSYDGQRLLLHQCSFSITRCEVAMIAGPVGSGKSTLLQSILGEISPTHGSIYVEMGVIAYCGQVPWLPNMSIRDIITGGSGDSFDSVWYREVVSGCLLVEDLRRLPGGDQFRVGTGGVKLSGGQKHRVALARALYLRAAIIVVDDIFSALDQRTRAAILSRVFGEAGLIRRCLSTVIMTTHSVECLRQANKILFLNGEGDFTTSLNIDELLKRDDFQRLLSRGLIVNEKNSETEDEVTPLEVTPPAQEEEARKPQNEKGDAEMKLLKGDSTLYLFYFNSIGKPFFILWVFVMFLVSLTERFPEIYVRIWLDVDPEDMRFFIGYALLGVGSSIFTIFNHTLYYLNLVPESCENLHEMLIEATMGATMSFLTQTDTGSLLNRFSQDMTLLSQNLPVALFKFLYMTFIVMIDVVIVATTAKYAATIIPFLLIGLYIIQMFYLRTSQQMRQLDLEAKSPLYTQFSEITSGLHHIRSFRWVDSYRRQSYILLDYSQKPFYYMYCIQQWLSLTLDCCSVAISTVLALVAVKYKNSTTQAAIGLGFINMITFSLARLRNFLKTTPLESGPDLDSTPVRDFWPEYGDITISNLTASYQTETARHVALDDVSVEIQGGMKVGIIGRTGSGKSSLLLALLNFLDYSGSIQIDGVEISEIPLQELRSRITTITQDYVELDGAVRDNLFPHTGGHSDAISDDAAVEALKKVGLWERISSSGGLNATLAKLNLSQGEKQLLFITRAFLHHKETGSKVILVDEATSSMDQDTDRNVQALMREVFEGSTILMVAHRHETIEDADLLIELADGKIIDISEFTSASEEEEYDEDDEEGDSD
ncbi:hypothetical protein K4F52_001221 [Lecanicillium sp. MT-2017a]|nr:hypothetical protein K4F52_001221 [Lecanicillium sp. MT-2017a]